MVPDKVLSNKYRLSFKLIIVTMKQVSINFVIGYS